MRMTLTLILISCGCRLGSATQSASINIRNGSLRPGNTVGPDAFSSAMPPFAEP